MPQYSRLDRPDSYYERLAARRNAEHWPDCHCRQCWSTPVCCIPCRYEFRDVSGLRRHREVEHSGRLTKRDIRAFKAQNILVPDGLGYLQRVLASEQTAGRFDLQSISRFAEALNLRKFGKTRQPRFRKLDRRMLRDLEASPTDQKISVPLSSEQALAVYRIAVASGVTPAYVASALISYGLEHLSLELRKHPTAPVVPIPKSPVKQKETQYTYEISKRDAPDPRAAPKEKKGLF